MMHQTTRGAARPAAVLALVAAVAVFAGCSRTAEEPPPATTQPSAAAAAPASQAAAVHRFQVGELSAMALRDGRFQFPNDNQVFGVGLTPADVAAVLSSAGLAADSLELDLHPLLVRTADRVLLFDAGAGAMGGASAGKLSAAFADAGVDPATVTDVFISHSHGDHVGGLVNAGGELAFPNATIHLSAPEWQHLSKQADQAALVAAVKPRVDAFAPGAELVPGVVTAVEIKGHTPGHSGYRIVSGNESLLYIGDAMHHHVVSVRKPEWTIQFDGDSATATASRIALIDEVAAGGQRLYGFHFPFPGLGRIEKRGGAAMWVGE